MTWLYPIVAFLAVAILIPVFRRFAPALRLLDSPSARKQHEGAVPLIGGLVVLPIFILVSLLVGFSLGQYWTLYLGVIILLITGAVDDALHVRPSVKFVLQMLVAGLVVVIGGAQISTLGNLFGLGDFDLGFMAIPFSFAAVMLLINAVNLMDGLDGLAGSSVLVMLGFLTLGSEHVILNLTLMASIAGFLVYNIRHPWRQKASVFLGDAGSLALGLCLAWFAIEAGKGGNAAALHPMSVAWILALPIMDTCAQFYRRVREGRHPFSPDRGHFHHHFIEAGFRDGRAVAMILLVVAAVSTFGVFAPILGVPLYVLTGLWIVMILLHMAVSRTPHLYVSLFSKFTFLK